MSAPIAKSQLTFELPKLTYVDASMEEPDLRSPARPAKRGHLRQWIAGLRMWWQRRSDLDVLAHMNDRELQDMGLNRADLYRVFDQDHNRDLQERSVS
jgi:uncharacterized protein YjiS (DUF1127 family)